MTAQRPNLYPSDVAFFLVLIPFISAFNYYLTYSHIHFNWFLAVTFGIDTMQGYAAWWVMRSLILFLDRKYPYEKNLGSRIVVQLLITSVAGLTVISMLTELVSWIAKGKPAPLNFYTVDLFIIGIWFFVLNGIYVGMYYYYAWKSSELSRAEENRVKAGGLAARVGKLEFLITFDELAGIYVNDEYAAAYTMHGQKYLMDESLDKLEKKLPAGDFFRLNRQCIIHRQWVTGFKRIENGKILVYLNRGENLPAEIPVSRTKVAAFKQWFRPE